MIEGVITSHRVAMIGTSSPDRLSAETHCSGSRRPVSKSNSIRYVLVKTKKPHSLRNECTLESTFYLSRSGSPGRETLSVPAARTPPASHARRACASSRASSTSAAASASATARAARARRCQGGRLVHVPPAVHRPPQLRLDRKRRARGRGLPIGGRERIRAHW